MKVSKSVYMMVGLLATLAFVIAGCGDPTTSIPSGERPTVDDDAEVRETPEDEEEVDEPEEEPEDTADRTEYELSLRSMIGFVGSSPITGSQRGHFEQFEGSVSIVGEDLSTLQAEAVIDTSSVVAGSDTLVEALRRDILNVEEYPEIRFTSTEVEEDNGQYTLVGDLEMHGVTREIGIPIENPAVDGETVSMEAYFSINRENWDIYYEGYGWDPPGFEGALDGAIRPNVAIQLDLQADLVD